MKRYDLIFILFYTSDSRGLSSQVTVSDVSLSGPYELTNITWTELLSLIPVKAMYYTSITTRYSLDAFACFPRHLGSFRLYSDSQTILGTRAYALRESLARADFFIINSSLFMYSFDVYKFRVCFYGRHGPTLSRMLPLYHLTRLIGAGTLQTNVWSILAEVCSVSK